MLYFIGEEFLEEDEYKETLPEYVSSEIGMNYKILTITTDELISQLANNIILKYNIVITINKSLENIKRIKVICQKSKVYYINIDSSDFDIVKNSYALLKKFQNKEVDNYKNLSKVYDKIQNRMEYNIYIPIFQKYLMASKENEKKIFLELGAGSGKVTEYLQRYNLNILATDLSEEFLNIIKAKSLTTKQSNIETMIVDITKLNNYKFKNNFDYIGMFLDTLNYINPSELNEVFRNISNLLNDGGLFIFDIHKEEKMEIFDCYTEEIEFDEFLFHWMSVKESDNEVHHKFTFINDKLISEKHVQYIHPLTYYQNIYLKFFNEVEVINKNERYIIILENK